MLYTDKNTAVYLHPVEAASTGYGDAAGVGHDAYIPQDVYKRQVLFQLEHPLSSEENRALRVELTRLKQVMDDPDTDTVTRLAVHNILGPSGAWNGYELIEF